MFFSLFDINNNGRVSRREFEIIITYLLADFEGFVMNHKIEQLFNVKHTHSYSRTHTHSHLLLKVVDVDHSYSIDIDEFTKFYKMIIDTRTLSGDAVSATEI